MKAEIKILTDVDIIEGAEMMFKELNPEKQSDTETIITWIIEKVAQRSQHQLKERNKEIAHLRGEVKILKPLAEELMSDKTQTKEDEIH